MKHFILLAALLLAAPAFAQTAPVPAPKGPPPTIQQTVPMQVDYVDLQIYMTAIHDAAALCGATHEIDCQIGLQEQAQKTKLNDAVKALQAAQGAAALPRVPEPRK